MPTIITAVLRKTVEGVRYDVERAEQSSPGGPVVAGSAESHNDVDRDRVTAILSDWGLTLDGARDLLGIA